MACTVFAEKMGFFHKGSNGKGIAPGDVCLSPPPPPAGPVPVPYVNMLSASDLIKGSTSVKIDGNPTALESSSEIAMSTGNEPATPGLGAGVVTHRIKGKGSFTLWSFTVKVEGKGVCRHGDALMQNEASSPPNCTAPGALVLLKAALGTDYKKGLCTEPYDSAKHRPGMKQGQKDQVYGKKCWECARQIRRGKKPKTPGGRWMREADYSKADSSGNTPFANRDRKAMTPDHQPPLNRAWELGGCHMKESPDAFKAMMSKPEMVRAHCRAHSNSQGSKVSAVGASIRDALA